MRLGMTIGGQLPEGIFRDSLAVSRYAPTGELLNQVGNFPGIEMSGIKLTFGQQTIGMPSPILLGRQAVIAAGGDRVYVAENDRWEVKQLTPEGTLRRLIRIAAQPLQFTEAEIAALRQDQLDEFEGNPQVRGLPEVLRTQILDQVKASPVSPHPPWISSMVATADGHLWVDEVVSSNALPRSLVVIDSTGTFPGRVTAPPRFRLGAVLSDRVIGVWRDADDVEHVRVYRLVKPASGS
jgi:hypothetical protein